MPDATPTRTGPAPSVPTETIEIHDRVVACDGGNGVLGHPRVWLRIPDGANQTFCPYCSRLYVLSPGVGHASGH